MLGRRIWTTIRNGDQTTNRADEDAFARPTLVAESANEFLRQFQWGEEISLKHASKQLHRDFGDGAAFSDCSIVDQRINVPIQCVLDVVGMQQIKFLNSNVL